MVTGIVKVTIQMEMRINAKIYSEGPCGKDDGAVRAVEVKEKHNYRINYALNVSQTMLGVNIPSLTTYHNICTF